jgi:hypothetical protein
LVCSLRFPPRRRRRGRLAEPIGLSAVLADGELVDDHSCTDLDTKGAASDRGVDRAAVVAVVPRSTTPSFVTSNVLTEPLPALSIRC